jgi:polar amino acid transport system permease protein
MYELNFSVIYEALPSIINGLKITFMISALSSVCAFIIGIMLAFMRNTNFAAARYTATAYVELVRNIPLLILLYLFYSS